MTAASFSCPNFSRSNRRFQNGALAWRKYRGLLVTSNRKCESISLLLATLMPNLSRIIVLCASLNVGAFTHSFQ